VKFSVGDTLTLSVGNRMDGKKKLSQHDAYISGKETLVPKTKKAYTVVGICERPSVEEYQAPGYTLITTADATDKSDDFSLFVALKNPRQVHAYAADTGKGHAYTLNDNVLRFMGLSDDNIFNMYLYSVAGIVLFIIMVGSIFLIYNSFNISLNERTHQFGILSSVGATAKQLRNSVLFEGLCIGAVGIPLGMIVGIGSTSIVILVVAGNFDNIFYKVPLTLTISPLAIILAAVVSMVTILISAYIPAKKAADTPVMESIRQTNEVRIDSKAVKTSKIAERILGLEGTLALKNFKRNKKRYRSIVLSLVLSVVLFVSASAFGKDLKEVAKHSVVDMDDDIIFTTQNMNESEWLTLYDKLKTADGVYKSSYQEVLSYSCAVKASNFSGKYRKYDSYALPDKTINLPVDIQFIEDNEYLRFIKSQGLSVKEYTGQNAKMVAVAKKRIVKNDAPSEIFNMFSSPSMTVRVTPKINDKSDTQQEQSINLTFVNTYPIDPPETQSLKQNSDVFMVIAPYSQIKKFASPLTQSNIGLAFRSTSPSKSVAEMEKMIQSVGITSKYTLYNVAKILEQNRNIIFVVHLFTYVFSIMITLIAIANVFNTISTNIKLRRRELAMLRSVGMSDRNFQKMMNFECIFYGMRALLFGIPIATIVSWLIYRVGGADIDFIFPWGSMVISIFGVFFVVFITMLYSISKIKKENIIDALRDDLD